MNIVLDIYSGSVHIVDEVAYDIIEKYESVSREEITADILKKYDVAESEIDECFEQIEELKNAGKLFKKDTFAPMAGELK